MKANSMLRTLFIIMIDVMILAVADIMAVFVRFDFSFMNIPEMYLSIWKTVLPLQIAITLVFFFGAKMYNFVWHFVGIHEVARMIVTIMASNAAMMLIKELYKIPVPNSVLLMSALFQIVLFSLERCSLRLVPMLRRIRRNESDKTEPIMIIGAGEAGKLLVQEIAHNNRIHGYVACFIDDNPQKKGRFLDGIRIYGGRECIVEACDKFSIRRIILAIPTVSPKNRSDILSICSETGCFVQTLPGIDQIVDKGVSLSTLQSIHIEDLLERDPIQLDLGKVRQLLEDKVVMVTGGGGSIGSELCRQIMKYFPRQLIVLDIYENNAYDLQQELLQLYGRNIGLRVEIASVRDSRKLNYIFEKYHPQIVFHAAAHKHVPLMENCPEEAVKNNIFGTYNVACAAEKYGAEKFVMISTDKAVNPTNFMGASKRFCEMILQSRTESKTEFVAVRFGNVLGSNGSVVPLFQKQIAAGGPITLTDKRIIRYFMTIPEAAQLVLDAGAMAKQNQVFVLDMGHPVKILSLAENIIRLQGLEPYTDIDIQEIGLRPGEKLYEELLIKSEDLIKTANEKIFVEQQSPISREQMQQYLDAWQKLLDEKASPEEFVSQMRRVVTTYHTPEEVNSCV